MDPKVCVRDLLGLLQNQDTGDVRYRLDAGPRFCSRHEISKQRYQPVTCNVFFCGPPGCEVRSRVAAMTMKATGEA